MSDNELRERLADLSHQIWADWMRYQFSKCSNMDILSALPPGHLIIPPWAVERWARQINTPYTGLSEQEKDSDREQADKILRVIKHDD